MLVGGSRIRAIATLVTVALVGFGCSAAASTSSTGPTSRPSASEAPATQRATETVTPAQATPEVASPVPPPTVGLVVLADAVQGGYGLWQTDGKSWTAVASIPTGNAMTAIPGGILVANGPSIETRMATNLGKVSSSLILSGSRGALTTEIAAMSQSPGGKLAIATGSDTAFSYFTATRDGALTALAGAPESSFEARLAWLDDARLLVLSTDTQQVSRIGVLDTASGKLSTLGGLTGCRDFSLSGDGQMIAAATESGIYADSTSAWQAGNEPQKVAASADFGVVWGLALDQSGGSLAVLAGTVAADGSVSDVHELIYTKGDDGWTQTVDLAAPFTTARAQVWLG
jgi:hypothetical protein